MSKTFKSVTDNESELDVRANDCGVFIAFSRAGQIRQASTFAPSDAPALALAILEAAGYKEEQGNETTEAAHHFGMSMLHLRYGIKEQEYITAEAEAQAKLEAEALELFRAFQHVRTDGVFVSVPSFASLSEPQQVEWLAVARRAREMRAEK